VTGEVDVAQLRHRAGKSLALVSMSRIFRSAVQPEWCVLVVGLVVGVAFAMQVVPLAGHDEVDHLVYALGVSHGHVIPLRRGDQQGMVLPVGEVAEVRVLLARRYFNTEGSTRTRFMIDHFGLPGNSSDVDRATLRAARDRETYLQVLARSHPTSGTEFVAFTGTVSYPPLPMIVDGAAMAAGRALGLSTEELVRLARIVGLLAYLGFAVYAVRRFRGPRWMLAICAVVPVALFQASMVSADGITNGLAFLVLALGLQLAIAAPDVDRRLVAEAAIAAALLALSKPPYLLVALVYLVPIARARGRVLRVLVPVLAAGFAVQLAFTVMSSGVNPYRHYVLGLVSPRMASSDAAAQVRFIRAHPDRFVTAIGHTVGRRGGVIAGNALFETHWKLDWPIRVVFLALLVIAALGPRGPDERVRIAGALRAVLLSLALVTTFVILVAAYIGWNPVGASWIFGVQGRYLLPLIPMVLVCVPALRWHVSEHGWWWFGAALSSTLLVTGLALVATIPARYT